MTFQFESFSAFLHMAGHGPYVWSCYVLTIAALIMLVTKPLLQKKALKRSVQRRRRLEQTAR